MQGKRLRLDYVDGLRGVAIALVVITHGWMQYPPAIWDPTWWHNKMVVGDNARLIDYLANRGYQGVSLFLVLSGFCLAYPALVRRSERHEDWFRPSQFFARRCLRILPPYISALLLSIVLIALFRAHHWRLLPAMTNGDISVPDIVTHALLFHNLTTYAYAINSPFWSLALEWQWYWVFPVVFLLAVRFPYPTFLGTLILAAAWQATMEDNPILMSWLPGRLFEFSCGVLVAQLVVKGFRVRPGISATGAVCALVIAELPAGTFIGDVGLYQPLYGIAFALLLLTGSISARAQSILSWRPLVRLGVASYSIYLVHRPASDAIQLFAPIWLRSSYCVVPVAIAGGLTAGWIFHLLVERPCMSIRTWQRVGPPLQRLLRWTDLLYGVPRLPKARIKAHGRDGATVGADV